MVENKVRERRKELGMTLKQLSRESGIPVSTLEDIEHGMEPRVIAAQRIAAALYRTTNELWPDPEKR